MLKNPKLPMYLHGILSLLFRPELLFCSIPVPLYRLVICGVMLLMVLDGFTGMPLFMFRPKSILILSQLLQLLKDKSQSLCAYISMEYLAWLACTMSLSPNRALLIVRSLNHIIIANNERCFILVRLVSTNWSTVDMDIFLAVFLPNGVDSDSVGILLR